MKFEELSDSALVALTYEQCKTERELLVDNLWALAALDKRKAVVALGFSSLFAFCTQYLGLSKPESWRRKTAARLLARFPILAEYLADKRLSLGSVCHLREVLDESRLDEILSRAAGRTEEEVEALAAALKPQPAPADLFRKLPTPAAKPAAQQQLDLGPARPGTEPHVESREVRAPERQAGTIKPINAEQHVLRITVSSEFKADLDALRDELSHKLPGATLEQLLHECVRERLKVCRRRRWGAGKKNAASPPKKGKRFNPAAVKHEVWVRDEGRCTYVGPTGHRCNSTHQVEIHHLHPHERGGPATVENLTLRCRAHNQYAAEQDYGAEHIARAIASSRSPARESQGSSCRQWSTAIDSSSPSRKSTRASVPGPPSPNSTV
jgi:5-methylcytosine-specific restriction endonuclease McrA